jgi:hypothetical protein
VAIEPTALGGLKMADTPRTLEFGYRRGLPAGRTVAWGARLIVTQAGDVDLIHDRQDAIGAEEPLDRLLAHLNGLDTGLRQLIAALLRSGDMQTRVAQELVVHQDDVIVIKANTNASAGYCYVVAYFARADAEAARS